MTEQDRREVPAGRRKGHNPYGDVTDEDRKKGITDHIVLIFISAAISTILGLTAWLLVSTNNSQALTASMAATQRSLAATVLELREETKEVKEGLLGLNATFATKQELKEEIGELRTSLKELTRESSVVSERVRLLELRLKELDRNG